jgi:thiamine biosynthesis lipoprotein
VRLPALFAGLALFLGACAPQPQQVFKFGKPLMHTRWDFSLVAARPEKAQKAFEAAAREIERLDLALAMWRPESELAAFNAEAGRGPQGVSADLDAVLALGQKVSELSGGASDCSVGPLVQLWYERLKDKKLPKNSEIAAAKALVDYRRLKREGPRLWSSQAGTRVDLGSLAKGYAQDAAAKIIRARGIKNFLINAGGQVYAAGRKPDGSKWRVGVINPRDTQALVTVVPLEDQGMSTSGDYEQGTVIRGRRYHHIIDPKTGWPAAKGVRSVTVILPITGAEAPGAGSWCDALDTAALVLGMGEGKKLLEGRGASGLLIHQGPQGALDASLTDDLKGKVELRLN